MKVYTKNGDKGETSLFGGTKVSKGDLRIHAYGTVDELNCYIGLLRDVSLEENIKSELLVIQDRLFTLGSRLATEKEEAKRKLPFIFSDDLIFLEQSIDNIEKKLDPITVFILPGGHITVSYCHIARCICRRCERMVVELSEQSNVEPLIITYLNRLSDYLFVLSRYYSKSQNVKEIPWIPKK